MGRLVLRFIDDARGATAIEHGRIVARISVAIITAVTSIGANLKARFGNINAAP